MDVEQAHAAAVGQGAQRGAVELAFGADLVAAAAAENLRQLVVLPGLDVVELVVAGVQQPLGAVALVVQHDDDRVEAVADDGRQFHAGHLERPVAHQHDRPQVGPGDHRAQRRRHGKAHRRVVGRADELRLPVDHQLAGGEQGVARIGNHHHRLVQRLVQPGDQPPDGDRIVGPELERLVGRLRPRRQRPRRRLQAGGGQPVDEIAQQHVVEVVVADAQRLAGGVDALGGVEIGREDAHVDVGHELAQQDHAVALLDELRDLLAAHARPRRCRRTADAAR